MAANDQLKSALADRYEIEREIGSGGMATVYLARDVKHNREVALKVLRADLSAVMGTERFLSEVRISARLDHPHILTLIDSGEANGILFYVLPLVRGESLRAKLDRERQLPVDEAISITKQVAGALDYAHSKGVIHRDIKPENILLHEGEAVLADFGIALAVQEAGGNRLTETGLSLGTPQYMSPEQASGDRSLDKRTDVYSLGAVFYEMLAGEPPFSAPSSHALIAKLMMEKPTKLRIVRPAVSEAIDLAADRALAKTPADRFGSAGEFARALTVITPPASTGRKSGRVAKLAIAAAALVAAAAGGVWIATHKKSTSSPGTSGVTNRTRVTSTGNVRKPKISPDGKSFAYVLNECGAEGCRYSIYIQDIGGPGRKLVSGLASVYQMEISPDRRYVLFNGGYKGRLATYLVSVLGGEPHFISTNIGSFYAGSDSLLMTRATTRFDSSWIIIAGLDAKPADSIRVSGPADDFISINSVPGSNQILFALRDGTTARWHSMTRDGRVVSTFSEASPVTAVFPFTSANALWLSQSSITATDRIVVIRVPLDGRTGKFGEDRDTVYIGNLTSAGVTADGKTLMVDEASVEYTVWQMSLNDVVRGSYDESKSLLRSTAPTDVRISPDGKWLLLDRRQPAGDEHSFSVMPFPSGPEKQIPGNFSNVYVFDSASASAVTYGDGYSEFSTIDLRTGQHRVIERAPKIVDLWTRMGKDGWIWRNAPGRMILTRAGQKSRSIRIPADFVQLQYSRGNPAGSAMALAGFRTTYDSIAVGVMNIADQQFRLLWSTPGEGMFISWIDDETLLIQVAETTESFAFYRLGINGSVTRLGTTRRPTEFSFFSSDTKRGLTVTRDHRGDAWMMKVVQ